MKIAHLGKLFLISIITTVVAFAQVVETTLSSSQIVAGDVAKLTIKAEGKDIEFPNITTIAGYNIIEQSNSSNIVYINGHLTQSQSKSYYFRPTKDAKIAPLDIKVDGKVYKSKELEISVVKPKASAKGQDVILEINATKTNAKVGEPIELKLIFKVKRGVQLSRVNIVPPKLENFWAEQIRGEQKSTDGVYDIVTYRFLITPQKSGTLKIPPTYVNVGKAVRGANSFNDPFFGTSIRWQKIYSNEITINVEPLPNNLELYGHFLITAKVDKKVVNANEPLNLTIKVKGEGNLDDIKKFDIQVPNAMVYNNEPKVYKRVVKGKHTGEFKQKVAIVAENNYTIAPIKLEYFDSKLQKVVVVKTNPIFIKVKPLKSTTTTSLPTKQKIELANNNTQAPSIPQANSINIIYLVASFLTGVALTLLFINLYKKEQKTPKPITIQIKKTKSDKELYKLLLPYTNDEYIKDKIQKLEANIYKNANNKIDKKELIAYFEEVTFS